MYTLCRIEDTMWVHKSNLCPENIVTQWLYRQHILLYPEYSLQNINPTNYKSIF